MFKGAGVNVYRYRWDCYSINMYIDRTSQKYMPTCIYFPFLVHHIHIYIICTFMSATITSEARLKIATRWHVPTSRMGYIFDVRTHYDVGTSAESWFAAWLIVPPVLMHDWWHAIILWSIWCCYETYKRKIVQIADGVGYSKLKHVFVY